MTCSQQQREESHQQQEASDDCSQHTANHSESDDEIFALEKSPTSRTTVKTSSPNKTTYWKLPLTTWSTIEKAEEEFLEK
jgi:hypothetical protein